MNDLQTLHDAWETPPAPSHDAWTDARAALLAHAARQRRRRRAPLRITAIATAAAIAATFVLVVQNLGDASPVAAAEVFERAAHAAETKPFTAPRPDQWIYTEDRFETSAGEEGARRIWQRADGGGIAYLDERGKLQVQESERPSRAPFDSYEQLAQLPTDSDALLEWGYRQARIVEGAGATEDGDVYAIFSGLLAQPLPPELEAAVFRTMKRVPGVTVSTVDVLGRRVLSLEQTEDSLRVELFLDPETYAFVGKRATQVGEGVTGTVIRVATEIQDRPHER